MSKATSNIIELLAQQREPAARAPVGKRQKKRYEHFFDGPATIQRVKGWSVRLTVSFVHTANGLLGRPC